MATDSDEQPMILHSDQASTRGAMRVAKECRSEYRTKGRTPDNCNARQCCFFSVLWSMWPLLVGGGHILQGAGG